MQRLARALLSCENASRVRLLQASSRVLDLQVVVTPLEGAYEGVSVINLDRPEARNALSKQLVTELRNALDTIRQEKTTRCIIIESKVPGVFSAGADLKERATMSQQEASEFVNQLRDTFSMIQALPMPTIAVVDGAALGGGAEMALACDFRVCGPGGSFGWPETRLGIIPGAGGTQRLSRLVGVTAAKELIFSGRRISGDEAARLGLVTAVAPPGGASRHAADFAATMAASAPLALRAAKQAIDAGINTDLATGLKIEELCYARTMQTRDRLEGLLSFREKRKPVFTGE